MVDFDPKGKVLLGIAAHPDDLDFGASGTISKWIQQGATGYYLILTDGSKGFEDHTRPAEELVQIRHTEQKAACNVLGVKEVFFLDFVDGELMNTPEVRKEVVKIIRKLKPDIVFANDPTRIYDENRGFINHPDHRAAGQIALDAVFPFARNARSFPELLGEDLAVHNVQEVCLTNPRQPNCFIDIGSTLELKLEALRQHQSQHADPEMIQGFVRNLAKDKGQEAGLEYAESFVRIKIAS